ncbi:MAG: hypothetical protein AAFP78_05270, partial [Pseudomonadota bacterium]
RCAGIPPSGSPRIACFAQIAEVAPAPGGAIVRGAALIEAGVPAARSAAIVAANAVLWIACAVFAAALVVNGPGWATTTALAAGAAGMALSTLWIARIGSVRIALLSVLLRVVGLPIAAFRMALAFAALSAPIPAMDGFVFAFASIAGSAASIAPAGLGVSEALAALLAPLTEAAPAAAFLAVALNRLVGFAVAGLACGLFALRPSGGEPRDG